MAEASFGSILDRPPSEVERPKPIPAGTYQCIIKQRPRFDKSTRKGTEFVEFQLTPLAAADDIDEDDLEAALTKGDGSKKNLSDVSIRATFYLTEDAMWRLKKFLVDDLQIEEQDSFRTMIDQTLNREVMAYVKHTPSDDGTAVFANLASTSPVREE